MPEPLYRCKVMRDPLALALAETTALLKAENLDAWLSLLLARPAARPAMLGAWALLAESARLPWRLGEPLLCRLRMEFWRMALLGEQESALPAGQGEPPPLLALWPPALPRNSMAEGLAHVARLADGSFDSVEDVKQWSEATFAPLFATLMQATCVSQDGRRLENAPDEQSPELLAPLRALARAYGAGFLLRRAPYPRRATSIPLLIGMLADRAGAMQLAEQAAADHATARAYHWPRRLLPALWPVSLMMRWLRTATRHDAFPGQPLPAPSQLSRQIDLLWHKMLGTL